MDNNSENSSINYSEVMEPEVMLESDKSKGINQPGLTQGVSYVDCNGNIRHKYETLEVLSNRLTTKGSKDETLKAKEPTSESEKNAVTEQVTEELESPAADTSNKVADDVVKSDEKVEETPKPEPKTPVKKTTTKTTAKKTTTKTPAKTTKTTAKKTTTAKKS